MSGSCRKCSHWGKSSKPPPAALPRPADALRNRRLPPPRPEGALSGRADHRLDAASKLAVREFIRSLNRTRGTTILLTTHDMQDIEALTRRIILIGKGRILLDGPLEDLKETLSPVRTVIASGREKAGALSLPEGVSLLSRQGEGNVRLTLSADTRLSPVPALIESLSRQMELSDLSVEQASMDEVVLSLYKQYKI